MEVSGGYRFLSEPDDVDNEAPQGWLWNPSLTPCHWQLQQSPFTALLSAEECEHLYYGLNLDNGLNLDYGSVFPMSQLCPPTTQTARKSWVKGTNCGQGVWTVSSAAALGGVRTSGPILVMNNLLLSWLQQHNNYNKHILPGHLIIMCTFGWVSEVNKYKCEVMVGSMYMAQTMVSSCLSFVLSLWVVLLRLVLHHLNMAAGMKMSFVFSFFGLFELF